MRSDRCPSIRVVGDLLSHDTLRRVAEGDDPDLPGLTPKSYGLEGQDTIRAAANQAWSRLEVPWKEFRATVLEERSATALTYSLWLRPLFAALGYGHQLLPPTTGAAVPVSHLWGQLPIHLVGADVPLVGALKRPETGVARSRKREPAPFSLVQDLVNRSEDPLWGMVCNGRRLMLLRDSSYLSRRSYLEFDLEAMFDGEIFADFVVLYAVCHASRFAPPDQAGSSQERSPKEWWIERWREQSIRNGTRARERLRGGVTEALETLGKGFVNHQGNDRLREALETGELTAQGYYRLLLRLIYRLLFCFVIEDRDLLHGEKPGAESRERYTRYFSTRRLRDLATRGRVPSPRHSDRWAKVKLVFDALGGEGLEALGLPALDSQLFEPGVSNVPLGACKVFWDASLTNHDLLSAVRPLAWIRDPSTGVMTDVDYRNLDSEELGGVYESLLELMPSYDPAARRFTLKKQAGNERKATGTYYTPPELIEALLRTTLDPLLDEAVEGKSAEEAEDALLRITVCDPSCGSGHFLLAAARRIARRVATVLGDPHPSEEEWRAILREVVRRCIYGVDVSERAVEMTKLSLTMEAFEPGKPLLFLPPNIRVGDALLGTTPALLDAGMPDAAFAPLAGDNPRVASSLKRRNREERREVERGIKQLSIFPAQITCSEELYQKALRVEGIAQSNLAQLQECKEAWDDFEKAKQEHEGTLTANAWCAAFFWNKVPHTPAPPTPHLLSDLASPPPEDFHQEDSQYQDVLDRTRAEVEHFAGVHRFFHWYLEFPSIFPLSEDSGTAEPSDQGWLGGFSCILGNPPWEKVKLQEKEFFAARHEGIAKAPNKAARQQMISALADENPKLLQEFRTAQRWSEEVSHFLHNSGRYPQCGRGDVNTASVFAELYRSLLSSGGRMGAVLPTGVVTDATTQHFFGDLVRRKVLVSLHDFGNEAFLLSRAVHPSFRFSLISVTGRRGQVEQTSFAFSTRYMKDLPARRFTMTPEEILLLNPNTGTCPVFRSRRDAEIALEIYRRVPVLVRKGDPRVSPWGVSFLRMFDMASDSARGLFHTREQLESGGGGLTGDVIVDGDSRYLPLYEAKMISCFDHRLGTYEGQTQAQAKARTLPRVTVEQRQDPYFEVAPRYWVADAEVKNRTAGRWPKSWFLGFRDIARSTDARTVIASVVPGVAVGHKLPLVLVGSTRLVGCLLANLNSLVLDYVSRLKVVGTNVAFFIMEQLPIVSPQDYLRPAPWEPAARLDRWITSRAIELTYTAWSLAGFAEDIGYSSSPFIWENERRALLQAELDAAFFHIYGLPPDDVEYVLGAFPGVERKDTARFGEYRTKRLILDAYDRMAAAIDGRAPFQTLLQPEPGYGPVHPQSGTTNRRFRSAAPN